MCSADLVDSGSLAGGGTLNWSVDMIRCYMNGNWSAFTGKINLTKNGANSNYEDHFIVNNSYGYPNSEISIGDGVKFFYNNWANTEIKVGAISGTTGGIIDGSPIVVGSKNIDATFNGTVQGNYATIKKVGTGNQTFAGPITTNCAISTSEGTLTLSGTKSGTGAITVAAGATLSASGDISGNVTVYANQTKQGKLSGNGTLRGTVTLNAYSIISPSDSADAGTLTFDKDLNLRLNTTYECTIIGRGIVSKADKIVSGGTINCRGTLKIVVPSVRFIANTKFTILSAESFTGEFSEIILPEVEGFEWDLSDLYTTGQIKIITATGINETQISAGVIDNSTKGIYEVEFENVADAVSYKVCNSNGQIVAEKSNFIPQGIETIDITDSEKGIYMLIISSKSGKAESFKLIKE